MSTLTGLQGLAVALLLGSWPGVAAERVRIAEARTIVPTDSREVRDASHDLSLYVYTFDGTRWSANVIIEGVLEAARLLAPCRVALVRFELRTVLAPRVFHFYSTLVSRELVRTLDVSKPAVFFVEDTHNSPAFDAEAIGLANAKTRPELANTVWVAYGTRDLTHALAHELVHLLSDSGDHRDEPGNLMQSETSTESSRLSPAQCERLRARGVSAGLLTPR